MRSFHLFHISLLALLIFVGQGALDNAYAQSAPTPANTTTTTTTTEAKPASSDQPVDQLLKKIESAPQASPTATTASVPLVPLPVPENSNVTTAPSQMPAPLNPAAQAKPIDAAPMPTPISVNPNEAQQIIQPAGYIDDNMFFDSQAGAPKTGLQSNTPRKVNPATQPASKIVIVTKDREASSPHAQMTAAERAMMLGRYDAAARIYDELYAKNKKDPNILLGRAIAYQKSGQTQQATEAYQALLEIQPSNMEAQLNMLGLMAQQYPSVAMQRLKSLSDKNPNNPGLYAQMAVVDANMGNYDEAMQYLGTAASIDPNNASHLYNMAIIADRAGKKNDAIQYYQKALEVDTIYGDSRSIPREAALARLAQLR